MIHIPAEITVEVERLLRAGLTYGQVVNCLRLIRMAIEQGHSTVRVPILPRMPSGEA